MQRWMLPLIIFITATLFIFSFSPSEIIGIYISLLILGVFLVLLSSKLGGWQYELNNRYKEFFANLLSVDKKDLWFMIGLQGKPRFIVWYVRVIGLVVIGYSIFRLIQ